MGGFRDMEIDKTSVGEMLGKQGLYIDTVRRGACRFDRLPGDKIAGEAPRGLSETQDLDAVGAPLDQEMSRAGIGIDCRESGVAAIEHSAPDVVGRMIEAEQGHGRMRHERDARLMLGRKRSEPHKVEGRGVCRVQREIHRPLEAHYVGEIASVAACAKCCRKSGNSAP